MRCRPFQIGHNSRTRSLQIESLEQRRVLAGDFVAGDALAQSGLHGDFPNGVIASDLNNDEHLDLVVSMGGPDWGYSILLGNGEGKFELDRQPLRVGTFNFGVAAADLDNDGNTDLVSIANTTGVVVLFGNGDATFTRRVEYDTGESPRGLVIADFDLDNTLDLAISHRISGDVALLKGVGDGSFLEGGHFELGHRPGEIAAADLDGDGDLDLVGAIHGCSGSPCPPSNIVVLLGDGDGAFQPAIEYTTHSEAFAIEIGDVDGDGDLDLVVSNDPSSQVSLFLGNGDGTFADEARHRAPGGGGRLVDLNHDGILDLLSMPGGDPGGRIAVSIGAGDGTFEREELFRSNPQLRRLGGMTTADVNGDGKTDVIVALFIRLSSGYPSGVSVFLNESPVEKSLPGDSNNDGVFDSTDLIVALSSGKYEDDRDASFAEGDWNLDARFNTEDLIFALAGGHYQTQ